MQMKKSSEREKARRGNARQSKAGQDEAIQDKAITQQETLGNAGPIGSTKRKD